MDLKLAGKCAVVTGGSRGIGKAIALNLASEGVNVAIAARNQKRLDDSVTEISKVTNSKVIGIQCETTNEESVASLMEKVVLELGGLDILVNNAAQPGGPRPKLHELSFEDHLLPQINTKVMGYLRCANYAVPHMRQAGWGRIINISGLQARRSGSIVGSVRNVAVSAITKNLADELGSDGINVNCVHPGFTRTEATKEMFEQQANIDGSSVETVEKSYALQNSVHRIIDAADIAAFVLFLASPLSIAITGETIAAGGGAGNGIYY